MTDESSDSPRRNWQLNGSLYLGIGGRVTLGEDEGKPYVIISPGVGWGTNLSFSQKSAWIPAERHKRFHFSPMMRIGYTLGLLGIDTKLMVLSDEHGKPYLRLDYPESLRDVRPRIGLNLLGPVASANINFGIRFGKAPSQQQTSIEAIPSIIITDETEPTA
ncbi:MAG: hypothetical protein ACOYLB_13410 [Phototrophicaceae bacterium]